MTTPAAAAGAPGATASSCALPRGVGLRRGYVEGPYGQIHYRVVAPAAGGRTPLVCLHASPLSGIVYDRWLVEMGRDRVALAPDTPGYGSSAAPPQPASIPDFAAAMIRFMDEIGLGQVDVMGYHTGAITSVELARSYPRRIRRVVMISAPIFTPEELAKLRAGIDRPVPTYEELIARDLDNWRRNGRGMFRDMSDDRYVDMHFDTLRNFRTQSWGFRAAFAYDLAAALPQVRQPVLVLNPEDDLWTMTPRARPLLNARSRVHDLPGWTHGHLDAHTAEMAAIVREFLDA